jgi:hypothetical protein
VEVRFPKLPDGYEWAVRPSSCSTYLIDIQIQRDTWLARLFTRPWGDLVELNVVPASQWDKKIHEMATVTWTRFTEAQTTRTIAEVAAKWQASLRRMQ